MLITGAKLCLWCVINPAIVTDPQQRIDQSAFYGLTKKTMREGQVTEWGRYVKGDICVI